MVRTHAVKLVELLVMLKPFLEEEMFTLEAFKGKCFSETFLLSYYIEGMSMCCAGCLKQLDHEGIVKLVVHQVCLDLF